MFFRNLTTGSRFIHIDDLTNDLGEFFTPAEVEVFTKICVVTRGAANAIGENGRLAEFDDESSVIALVE